jgi:hypothetical protein
MDDSGQVSIVYEANTVAVVTAIKKLVDTDNDSVHETLILNIGNLAR